MNDVTEFLKNYIWKHGFETLSANPYAVYTSMVKKNGIEAKTARLVLITLMSGTHEMAKKGCSADALAEHIQAEHFVNKKTAKDLATMYLTLFSDENKKSWNASEEAGFEAFCQAEWTIEWEGACDWHAKHGVRYPCTAQASVTFTVQDKAALRRHLSSQLHANPFLTEDDIFGILVSQVESDLDSDMQEYCDADDYYEPNWEEFVGEGTCDSEEKWTSWGLEIVEFTGSGDMDYEI